MLWSYGMDAQDVLIAKIPILRQLRPCEILRCKVLAWLAVFWLILAAQTIAESKNLTYFLATLILKIQFRTTLNCITSKAQYNFS